MIIWKRISKPNFQKLFAVAGVLNPGGFDAGFATAMGDGLTLILSKSGQKVSLKENMVKSEKKPPLTARPRKLSGQRSGSEVGNEALPEWRKIIQQELHKSHSEGKLPRTASRKP